MKTRQLSYKLRTKQVVLPVHKIKPVLYFDSKITSINEPVIGHSYQYKGKKVICITPHTKSEARCYMCGVDIGDCEKISCRGDQRIDNTTIILAPCHT